MSEENDTSKLKLASDNDSEETDSKKEGAQIEELMHYRNVKLYLDKMVGKQWMLLFMREDDGAPVYVPNENLLITDHVFLAELSKNIAFQTMYIDSDGED